jgi:hypothetical protein
VTLADLISTLERRAAEAAHVGAMAPVANMYRVFLEELRAVDSTVLASSAVADPPAIERHLTAEQVEELLQLPRGYAYDHKRQLGGMKVGKYLRFPESIVRTRLERSRVKHS